MNHVPRLVEVLSLRKKLSSVRVDAADGVFSGYVGRAAGSYGAGLRE
jgi:hypothetical protein